MRACRSLVRTVAVAGLLGLAAHASNAQSDLGFEPSFGVPLPVPASRIRLADVTGDGVLDIVLSSYTQPGVFVLPGLGGAAFGPMVTTALSAPVGNWDF